MQDDSESARRWRSALRAVLSPGVWLVVAAQVALSVIANAQAVADQGHPGARVVLFTLVLLGLLYLIAGASQALARGRDPVYIPAVLRAGTDVYLSFLWLIFKTGLLAALILQVAVVAAVALSGMEAAVLVEQAAPYAGAALAFVGFALVYWMPIVFVEQNFALFGTLKQAVRLAWRRLPVSGYVAFLTLAPAAVAVLAHDQTSAWIAAAVNLLASVTGWIAYLYGVEWCQNARRVAPTSLN